MTLAELHRLAQRMANGAHVRYWTWWNRPQRPWLMAISAGDVDHKGRCPALPSPTCAGAAPPWCE